MAKLNAKVSIPLNFCLPLIAMSEAAKVPICRYGFQDEDESLKSKCQEILGISLQGYRDVTGAAFYLSRMKGASEFDCNEIKKAFSLVLDC